MLSVAPSPDPDFCTSSAQGLDPTATCPSRGGWLLRLACTGRCTATYRSRMRALLHSPGPLRELRESPDPHRIRALLAVAVGFEPTDGRPITRFRGALLRPLGHATVCQLIG